MNQIKKMKFPLWIGLILGLAHMDALALSADAASTVHGVGYYHDAGPGFDIAFSEACLDAQTKCLNKSVKRITEWTEWVHRKEGYFTISEQATFECLPDAATEENLSTCAQR